MNNTNALATLARNLRNAGIIALAKSTRMDVFGDFHLRMLANNAHELYTASEARVLDGGTANVERKIRNALNYDL